MAQSARPAKTVLVENAPQSAPVADSTLVETAPRNAGPPLATGTAVIYFGPDQNNQERAQHAMVLAVIGDPSAGLVDLHIFNGAMIAGTTDPSGTYVPEYIRKNVPHSSDPHTEGWFYPGEFEAQLPTAPPAHVDVPLVYQEGVSLYCTMGNWEQPPTSYAYQWRRNGSPLTGETRNRYDTVSADIGTNVDCVLTTGNNFGSSSVTSNAVLVEAPAGSRVGEHETHLPQA